MATKLSNCTFHHHLFEPHKFFKHIGHIQRILFWALTGYLGFIGNIAGFRIKPKETGKAAGHLRKVYGSTSGWTRRGPGGPRALSWLPLPGWLLGRVIGFPLIRVAQSFIGLEIGRASCRERV